jgi:hypothetical protein
VRLGPDAARYILAGRGERVARPFHLRWLLPVICGDNLRRWQAVWLASWAVAAAGMFTWSYARTDDWRPAAAATALLVALPGVLGPTVVRPVGVDLPALALSLTAVALLEHGWWPLAIVTVLIAASIKESSPVWASLWAWHPLLLVGLLAPLVRSVFWRPKLDQVTMQPNLLEVHEHPVRTALAAHAGQWRDAWVMVAPWGICLAALYAPSWQLVAVLVVAYLQLLVATDTVRLLHTAAGPAVALAAAQVIPPQLLLLAVVVHVVWWRKPELI